MRTINIPTTYKLADLEEEVGAEKAKEIFEQIWLNLHPAAKYLETPLTKEQLDATEQFVHGQIIPKGTYQSVLAVLRKAFLIDGSLRDLADQFIFEEGAALNGVVPPEFPADEPIKRYGKVGDIQRDGKRVTPAMAAARNRNIQKAREVRAEKARERMNGDQ